MTDRPGFPVGRAVVLDDRVRVWRDASVVLGGAPWGVLRIAPAARDFVRRLADAGPGGAVPSPGVELAVADLLLARGIAHPVPAHRAEEGGGSDRVEVVVPVFERPELLDACLAALRSASPDLRVVVVDDASSDDEVARVARAHGADLVRHPLNRGPAAARNSGLRETSAPLVAFVDADCAVTDGWLDPLLVHFEDPRVAAVAPRIRSRSPRPGVLARYTDARSALDMGPRPELVAHGGPLGFLPSAALLVRRSALSAAGAFDEDLRVGEDVDLVWRLADGGGLVRYEPASVVTHETRPTPAGWAGRLVAYGTSAAALERRHPGRLTPARLSGWNLAAAGLLLSRRPLTQRAAGAVAVLGLSSALLARSLRSGSVDPRVAAVVVGTTLASDAESAGHLLRREWWPLGWLALLGAWRSHARVPRAAAAAMLIPLAREWRQRRPQVDPLRYLALRLVEDAAYGSGVLSGAAAGRRLAVLRPRISLPYIKNRRG